MLLATALGTTDRCGLDQHQVRACHHPSTFALASSTLFSLFCLPGWSIFFGMLSSRDGTLVVDTFIASYLSYLDKKLNSVSQPFPLKIPRQ